MLRRIRFKPSFALNGAVDFLRWNGALFYDSVSHNRRNRTVEEIENPVVGRPAGSRGVRRFRPAADPPPGGAVHAPVRAAFPPAEGTSPSPLPEVIEPLQERARAVFLAVNDDCRLRHPLPVYSQICESTTPRNLENCATLDGVGEIASVIATGTSGQPLNPETLKGSPLPAPRQNRDKTPLAARGISPDFAPDVRRAA
jgi:hypothetical protein